LRMRRRENELLAEGLRQLARRVPPSPVEIGNKWNNMYLYNIKSEQYTTIETTCLFISEHAYFFVDDRDVATLAPYIEDYGQAFDQIYQMGQAKFGTENDVDRNGKVIIVFSRELTGGLLGYFNAEDKFPRHEQNPYSNECDILYITSEYQGEIVKATMAHELQHMIYFDEHYDRKVTFTYTWLNEALSQAAEYYSGHLKNHLAWIAAFLYGSQEEGSHPNWAWGLSLTHWTPANYGYGALFIRYLIDQYGEAAIKRMCATDKVGVAAVEAATGRNFNVVFIEFTRAVVMSGAYASARPNPRYRFTTLDLRGIQPTGRGGLTTPLQFNAGDDIGGELFPYCLCFIRWTGDFGTMNLLGESVAGTVFGLDR
ncbi:MAG: hypothetical protein GX493_06050, partial [Firmicutes bacterium]|nr:hypothetical protein [Bacillota bacterium]